MNCCSHAPQWLWIHNRSVISSQSECHEIKIPRSPDLWVHNQSLVRAQSQLSQSQWSQLWSQYIVTRPSECSQLTQQSLISRCNDHCYEHWNVTSNWYKKKQQKKQGFSPRKNWYKTQFFLPPFLMNYPWKTLPKIYSTIPNNLPRLDIDPNPLNLPQRNLRLSRYRRNDYFEKCHGKSWLLIGQI
jgi:hypothetical protein